METLAQYNDRKRRELRLIRDAPLAPWPAAMAKPDDPVDEKRDAFRAHLMFRGAAAFPETNWANSTSITLGNHAFDYEYQRFDLRVAAPPIYPALGPSEHTIYTCSGMAAMTAVVAALNRMSQSGVVFCSVTDAYFETQHLVRHYADRLDLRVASSFQELVNNADDRFAVMHLDSISVEEPDALWGILTDRVILAVFDTTCYARADRRIQHIVHQLEARGIPLALVRSHLKLDSLGLEVGRLGSVQLHPPSQCGAVQRQVIQAVAHLVPDVVRLFGMAASIDRFFIVADEAELLDLSTRRAERISENCAALANEFDRAALGVDIRRYHHGMFLTLHGSDWTTPTPVRAVAAEVAKQCTDIGCRVARATSFGFDFTVLTEVFDLLTGRFCLRLAPSDEPHKQLAPVVSILRDCLRNGARLH